MKMFLVEIGEYSDSYVVGVFETKEEAEAVKELLRYPREMDITELTVGMVTIEDYDKVD